MGSFEFEQGQIKEFPRSGFDFVVSNDDVRFPLLKEEKEALDEFISVSPKTSFAYSFTSESILVLGRVHFRTESNEFFFVLGGGNLPFREELFSKEVESTQKRFGNFSDHSDFHQLFKESLQDLLSPNIDIRIKGKRRFSKIDEFSIRLFIENMINYSKLIEERTPSVALSFEFRVFNGVFLKEEGIRISNEFLNDRFEFLKKRMREKKGTGSLRDEFFYDFKEIDSSISHYLNAFLGPDRCFVEPRRMDLVSLMRSLSRIPSVMNNIPKIDPMKAANSKILKQIASKREEYQREIQKGCAFSSKRMKLHEERKMFQQERIKELQKKVSLIKKQMIPLKLSAAHCLSGDSSEGFWKNCSFLLLFLVMFLFVKHFFFVVDER